MTRLMIVSFAALGWVFYVMSGGPDFEPRGVRTAPPVPVARETSPPSKPLTPPVAQPLVAKAALRPVKPADPERESAPAPKVPDAEALLSQVAAGLKSGLPGSDSPEATFSLASLDDSAALPTFEVPAKPEAAKTAEPAVSPKDIREVSGTRVNMRDGPGTIYPVIGKVRMGQKVEVLSESGTGWLRLRVFPEQQVGWISASLVRKISN